MFTSLFLFFDLGRLNGAIQFIDQWREPIQGSHFLHCWLSAEEQSTGSLCVSKMESHLATASQPKKNKRKNKYQSTIAADKRRGKTRVNIGTAFERWNVVKETQGFSNHAEVAAFLLER